MPTNLDLVSTRQVQGELTRPPSPGSPETTRACAQPLKYSTKPRRAPARTPAHRSLPLPGISSICCSAISLPRNWHWQQPGPASVPATAGPAGRQHDWHALTEGPIVNRDAPPADEAADAAVDRIMRTRSGEDVELQSARELAWVWRRINQLSPGAFGVASSKGAAPVASSGHQQASSQSLTAERPATRHGGSASFRAHPAAS